MVGMELNKIKQTKRQLEIEVIGENETILNPIKQALVQNEKIDYAEYFSERPTEKKPRLYLRTTEGNPLDVLSKTVKQLSKETEKFQKKFDETTSKGKKKKK